MRRNSRASNWRKRLRLSKSLRTSERLARRRNEEGDAFIKKLASASGKEFDQLYMEAVLMNYEFLRDLTSSYLASGKKMEACQRVRSRRHNWRTSRCSPFTNTSRSANGSTARLRRNSDLLRLAL